MRLPPVLTAPVSALTPRQRGAFSWLTTAALLAILLGAARARFAWPPWPVAVTDTWGYLFPAISRLLGGAFEHTNGRNFVYPGFLYLLLRATHDFRAIPVAQHLGGLGTGALLWVAWRQWRGWSTGSRLPAWADAVLGLGLVAFYERSASVLLFEMEIRPEAIFPLAAALQVCLALAFGRAWWGDVRRPRRAAVLAGANLFAAALAYQLKPSYGLAAAVALLPVAWAAIFLRRQDSRARLGLLGGAAVAALAVLAGFTLPEHLLSRDDPMSRLFLPETLLTVHATVVRDQLLADVRAGADTRYPPAWLADAATVLAREVRRAGEPARKPYPTLGFNPDHLMYADDSFCHWLNETFTPAQTAAFAFDYYRRAWTHRPAAMLAIVGRQLPTFYAARCPAFWPAQKLKIERYYNKTGEAFEFPRFHEQMLAYAPARGFLDAAAGLGASTVSFRQPPWINVLNRAAARAFLPLLVLTLLALAATALLPSARRSPVWRSAAGLLLIMGALFGNCLTVAIVHSFDVERYCLNLLLYAALGEAAALAWFYDFVAAWLVRDPLPAAPAAAVATIPFSPQPTDPL